MYMDTPYASSFNECCQAQFQFIPSSVQLELSTALILIISTPTHPHTRDSSNETLLDFLGR